MGRNKKKEKLIFRNHRMVNKNYILCLVTLVMLFTSCDRIPFLAMQGEKTLLASVAEEELYLEDLDALTFHGLAFKDSLLLLEAYTDKWIKTQLKIKHSTLEMSKHQYEDIERKIIDYRNSLLTFNYDRSLAAHVDTVVSNKEINEYYNQNRDKFRLVGPIVKARILVYDKESKQDKKFLELAKSKTIDSYYDLKDLESKGSLRFEDFGDRWYYFKDVLKTIPFNQKNFDLFLMKNSLYSVTEMETKYLMNIFEYKLTDTYTPLNMVESTIRTVIVNQRRKNYIIEVEDSLFRRSVREGETFISVIDTISIY